MDQLPNRMGHPPARGATFGLLPLQQTRSLDIRIRNAAGEWISARLLALVHSRSRSANVQVQHTLIHPN
jgi:hypothetical protein